jgi:hypothetical protein
MHQEYQVDDQKNAKTKVSVSQRKIPESKTELYSTFAGREFSQRE